MERAIFLAGLVVLVGSIPTVWAEGPVAPGAEVELLVGGFKFTEGPAANREGDVFFTDQPNDRILKWSVNGQLSVFLEPAGRSNGLYFDRQWHMLACADLENQLWKIDQDGEVTVLVEDYQGKLLNGPNDVWVSPDGTIYFTDPYYKRPYWNRTGPEQGGQFVYGLSADYQQLTNVADNLVQPNGIVGTEDGRRLYVADIGDDKTYVYEIREDGSLDNRRLFCEMGSDGMTLDEEGNLYLTGNGVTIFDSAGNRIQNISVPERWTANVCFGGRDNRTLFITASEGLYGLRMAVGGARK